MAKKNPGKKFEEDFIKSVPDRCDVTRLKDGGGWSDASNMRFTSSNPCDFIVYSRRGFCSRMYKFELKSVAGKSIPFANIISKPGKKDYKKHLLEMYASEMKGVIAHYVLNFRSVNETYCLWASDIMLFVDAPERKSMPLEWCREKGSIINQTLIRVRYRYNLEWL